MSLRLAESFVNTNVPGAYTDVKVQSTPVGIGASGNILIIGEADGGADYSAETLKDNSFGPSQVDKVAAKYISGPIVDAMRAISAPSNDTDIAGSASRVFILKTNGSTKAQATVDTDYGTLRDQNFGQGGNAFSYKVLQITGETAPTVTSSALTIGDGSIFDGLSFSVRPNGGAATVITLSSTMANHDTAAELAAEISALLPAGMTCIAPDAASIRISLAVDNSAFRKGNGRSFELIDSTPGDLAALNVTANLIVSATEPSIEINVLRPDLNANELLDASADIALTIGYQGTTAVMTISGNTLTTTVTGGSGANQTINLSQIPTIKALSDLINSMAGYSASADTGSTSLSTAVLDRVTAIGICSSGVSKQPGRVKKAAYSFQKALSTSRYLSFSPTATAGLPAPSVSYSYLAGGSRGATTAADIVDALTKAEGVSVNFVVPLFSRDASTDIADGATDSSSTYTIDAIHASAKNHVLKMSSVMMKKNRIAMLSNKGTYAQSKAKSGTAASYRATMAFQDCAQTNSFGQVVTYQPWFASVVASGMQSAGFYKAIVKKFANIISYVDPVEFDSGNPGDISDALDAGLLFLETPSSGVRWVSDQTTYGFDTNFVYNSLQAVYGSDILTLDFADSLEKAFVGKSLADVDAATVASFITEKMDGYKKLKLITSSDDAPLGYRNVNIEINGPVLRVNVEIKLATAIYFIPITIEISQVQRAG